jgi:hypothetical protein
MSASAAPIYANVRSGRVSAEEGERFESVNPKAQLDALCRRGEHRKGEERESAAHGVDELPENYRVLSGHPAEGP